VSTADAGFAPIDHVTEREPGPWRDCTFAALLEVLRLGFPDGREIPATVAEKERLRAATGLPDDHAGATIDVAVDGAKRLYGLSGGYRVVTGWADVRAALLRPGGIAVVQGVMAVVPPELRRHDPGFTGAHAVAGRENGTLEPVWCDPLAPRGTYAGEPVPPTTWCDYFGHLPGAQAFVTGVGELERDMAITLPVTDDTPDPRTVDIPAGKQLYNLDGSPLRKVSVKQDDAFSPFRSGDYRAVSLVTGGERQLVLVRRIDVDDSRPLLPDKKHRVALAIDGAIDASTTREV
jgi:hypothetical protein